MRQWPHTHNIRLANGDALEFVTATPLPTSVFEALLNSRVLQAQIVARSYNEIDFKSAPACKRCGSILIPSGTCEGFMRLQGLVCPVCPESK